MEVLISASSAEEARDKAERTWKNGDYILDAEHFKNVEFIIEEDLNVLAIS